jgi:hypothetical protein
MDTLTLPERPAPATGSMDGAHDRERRAGRNVRPLPHEFDGAKHSHRTTSVQQPNRPLLPPETARGRQKHGNRLTPELAQTIVNHGTRKLGPRQVQWPPLTCEDP